MTDDALSAHVRELHRQAFTIDAHFDLAYDVANRRDRGQEAVIETCHLDGFRAGGFNLIVSSIYINDYFLPEMGLRKALDQISYLYAEIDALPGALRLCRNFQDLLESREQNQIGILLSFEGADPIQNDLNLLRIFYELGVRGVGLTWSRRNHVADGAPFKAESGGQPGGLTPFGRDLLQAAEALNMFIDVSHLNMAGFWDVMAFSRQPVIASHSNCHSLKETPRNLTDAQIKAIAAKDGVIGMNVLNIFIGDEGPGKGRLGPDDLVDHIDHIVRLVGVRHVGLGFDLCDDLGNYLQMPSYLESYDVIAGHRNLHQLTRALIRRGYTDADILLILGGNFLRFFKQVL